MAHLRYLRTFIDEEPPAEAMARSASQPALRPAMEASEEAACLSKFILFEFEARVFLA